MKKESIGFEIFCEIIKAIIILLIIVFFTLLIVLFIDFMVNHLVLPKEREAISQVPLDKRITVYDIQGEVQREYRGKYSIKYEDEYITFTDEQGISHIIYSPMGTVIIDDLETKGVEE